MFPTSDVLLSDLERRIHASFSPSLQHIAAVAPQVVFRTPSRISRTFPTINLRIAHSLSHIYDVEALLDSGATATYISSSFVADHQIPTQQLPQPIYAYNADDSLNSTAITHRAKLTCRFKEHVSTEWFFVTDIGSKTMIIGMTWLRSHNPEIDWRTGKVVFSVVQPSVTEKGLFKTLFMPSSRMPPKSPTTPLLSISTKSITRSDPKITWRLNGLLKTSRTRRS